MADDLAEAERHLEAEIGRLDKRITDLEVLRVRRDQLRGALKVIQQSRQVDEESVRVATPSRVDFAQAVVRQFSLVKAERTPATSTAAAWQVLEEAGRAMHIRDVVAEIQGRGWFADRTYESLRGSIAGFLDGRAKAGDGVIKPKPGTYLIVEPKEHPLAVGA